MKDGQLEQAELREKVADAAYCAVSANLDEPGKAALAGACIPVLADLERADLLEQAITEQRRILEPPGFANLSDEERKSEEQKIQAAIVPVGYGLLSVLRVGMAEQAANRDGRFCAASRAAIRVLKHIKAARTLGAILGAWTWKTFDAATLIPGEVLTAIIDLGVDVKPKASNCYWPSLKRTTRALAEQWSTGIVSGHCRRSREHWLFLFGLLISKSGSRKCASLYSRQRILVCEFRRTRKNCRSR